MHVSYPLACARRMCVLACEQNGGVGSVLVYGWRGNLSIVCYFVFFRWAILSVIFAELAVFAEYIFMDIFRWGIGF